MSAILGKAPWLGLALVLATSPAAAQVENPSAPARIRAAREIKVAAQVAGVVLARPVARNAHVEKGEVILRLDPTFFRLALRQAQANLERARADLGLAESEMKRAEKLQAKGSLNASDLDRARAGFASAQAGIHLAEASVSEAQERLARTDVKAPAAGVLSEIHPEVGELVSLQLPVAELLTTDDLVAESFLRPSDVLKFKVGMEVVVRLAQTAQSDLKGVVREVAQAAGRTRTYRVVVSLPSVPKTVRAGFDARILFPK